MKNLAVFLSLLTFGCSTYNDPLQKIGAKKLSTIRQTTLINNANGDAESTGNRVVTIENDQITKIQYGKWHQEKFYYAGNLLSKRVRSSGSLSLDSTLYTYDSRGRIIKIENNRDIPYPISNETSYAGNQISSMWKNAPGHVIQESYALTLNELGQIKSEEVKGSIGQIMYKGEYHYNVGNLTSAVLRIGARKDSIIFSYLNKLNNRYHKQFMFGSDWRLKSAIENAVNFLPLNEIKWEDLLSVYPSTSNNLVSGYSTYEVAVSFTYTFDNGGDLVSQIESREYRDGRKEKIITYCEYKSFIE